MYCVMCGVVLDQNNQVGLVCLTCYRELKIQEHRQKGKPILVVGFCFHCGHAYHPQDASIRHDTPCQDTELAGTLFGQTKKGTP